MDCIVHDVTKESDTTEQLSLSLSTSWTVECEMYQKFSRNLCCWWWFSCYVASYTLTPWTAALRAPLSMGFSGKKTEVGSHFLLQEIFLTEGSKPRTHISCTAGSFFTTKPPGKPQGFMVHMLKALLMVYANGWGWFMGRWYFQKYFLWAASCKVLCYSISVQHHLFEKNHFITDFKKHSLARVNGSSVLIMLLYWMLTGLLVPKLRLCIPKKMNVLGLICKPRWHYSNIALIRINQEHQMYAKSEF